MKEMKTPIQAFLALYDFHTKLFYNVLEGIKEKDAEDRLGTKANHIAWIAGSLVYERYELIKAIGLSVQYSPEDLFVGHKGLVENQKYPSLSKYKSDWEFLSPILKNGLGNLNINQLAGPDPFGMPGENLTLFDAIVFCIDRESYCIGQLGLYRRLLGYEAMKYD